jgi:hypothetical protein
MSAALAAAHCAPHADVYAPIGLAKPAAALRPSGITLDATQARIAATPMRVHAL